MSNLTLNQEVELYLILANLDESNDQIQNLINWTLDMNYIKKSRRKYHEKVIKDFIKISKAHLRLPPIYFMDGSGI